MPLQVRQSASQPAQVALLVGPQAAVSYSPPPHTAQVLQVVSCVAVQAAVWYCPAPQVAQAVQIWPLPKKPALQPQTAVVPVLVQVAFAPHGLGVTEQGSADPPP
jgi:hypothetical protein